MTTKVLTGKVTSNKMTKAVVVSIDSVKVHPMYKKRFKTSKKYTAACLDSSVLPIGTVVSIQECAPVSKTIKFKVV
jgi:small subunit ribosomal protein S17